MAVGETEQQHHYPKPAKDAFKDLERAMAILGKVTATDAQSRVIEGKCRYGLQTVLIAATVLENGEKSQISLRGLSDDLWAAGAKSGLARLIELIENIDNPNYNVNRAGIGAGTLLVRLILFFALFLMVIFAIAFGPHLGIVPDWFMKVLCGFGAVIIVYFTAARSKFFKKS